LCIFECLEVDVLFCHQVDELREVESSGLIITIVVIIIHEDIFIYISILPPTTTIMHKVIQPKHQLDFTVINIIPILFDQFLKPNFINLSSLFIDIFLIILFEVSSLLIIPQKCLLQLSYLVQVYFLLLLFLLLMTCILISFPKCIIHQQLLDLHNWWV